MKIEKLTTQKYLKLFDLLFSDVSKTNKTLSKLHDIYTVGDVDSLNN